jgi:hypothetical protein
LDYSVKSVALEAKLTKARKDDYGLDMLAIEHQRWDIQAEVLLGMILFVLFIFHFRNYTRD